MTTTPPCLARCEIPLTQKQIDAIRARARKAIGNSKERPAYGLLAEPLLDRGILRVLVLTPDGTRAAVKALLAQGIGKDTTAPMPATPAKTEGT